MKKFINVETGNVVRAKNAATIALMEKSNAYKEVTGKAAKADNKGGKGGKADDNKGAADNKNPDGGNAAAGGNADGANGGKDE